MGMGIFLAGDQVASLASLDNILPTLLLSCSLIAMVLDLGLRSVRVSFERQWCDRTHVSRGRQYYSAVERRRRRASRTNIDEQDEDDIEIRGDDIVDAFRNGRDRGLIGLLADRLEGDGPQDFQSSFSMGLPSALRRRVGLSNSHSSRGSLPRRFRTWRRDL
jgi:hypothetical protein